MIKKTLKLSPVRIARYQYCQGIFLLHPTVYIKCYKRLENRSVQGVL